MRYEVRVSSKATKQMASLSADVRAHVTEKIERLADWPHHGQDVRPLKGRLRGRYRLRSGDMRVLFAVYPSLKSVVIEQVLPRQRAYQ